MWERPSTVPIENPGLPFDLGIRQNLVEQLRHLIEDMGKKVVITYY